MRWCAWRRKSWLAELLCPTNSDKPTAGGEGSPSGLHLLTAMANGVGRALRIGSRGDMAGSRATWMEAEFCRMNKGKPAAKLEVFWRKFNMPHPEELDSTLVMDSFQLYTDLQESGYGDAWALGKCNALTFATTLRGLTSGSLQDTQAFLSFVASEIDAAAAEMRNPLVAEEPVAIPEAPTMHAENGYSPTLTEELQAEAFQKSRDPNLAARTSMLGTTSNGHAFDTPDCNIEEPVVVGSQRGSRRRLKYIDSSNAEA